MTPITITPHELHCLTEGAEALRLIALRLAEANPKETYLALDIRVTTGLDPNNYNAAQNGFGRKAECEYLVDSLSQDRITAPTLELALQEFTKKTDCDALLRKARLHREQAAQLEAQASLIQSQSTPTVGPVRPV